MGLINNWIDTLLGSLLLIFSGGGLFLYFVSSNVEYLEKSAIVIFILILISLYKYGFFLGMYYIIEALLQKIIIGIKKAKKH